MAEDPRDEGRRRRREREREEENEREQALANKNPEKPAVPKDSVQLEELLRRASPAIERVNSLYLQFLSGVEKRPPLEVRKQLEELINSIRLAYKPNPGTQFRCTAVLNQYQTYKDRWDNLIRDLESGKIKRRS